MKKKLTIGNETIEVDTDLVAGISNDLTTDMDRVASLIATYGAYYAAAKREQIKQKALYRNWKAKFKEALFEKDPKLADAKATSKAEAQKTFLDYKDQEAACEDNVTFLEKLLEALKEKSPNLRSRGAWERRELESHNMTTTRSEMQSDIQAKKEEYRTRTAKQPVRRS